MEGYENSTLCPFRVDERGDFMPCYGKRCMAYFEYEQNVPNTKCTAKFNQVQIGLCRRMAYFAPYISCT